VPHHSRCDTTNGRTTNGRTVNGRTVNGRTVNGRTVKAAPSRPLHVPMGVSLKQAQARTAPLLGPWPMEHICPARARMFCVAVLNMRAVAHRERSAVQCRQVARSASSRHTVAAPSCPSSSSCSIVISARRPGRLPHVQHPRFPSWVSWDSGIAAGRSFQQPPQNLDDFYTESTRQIGIIPPNFPHRDDLEHRIGDALAFQRTIDRVYHRTTYWVCSDGETVDLAVRIEPLEYETNSYLFDQIHTRSIVEYEGPSESRAHDNEELGTLVIHFFPESQSDGTVPDDSQHGYRMRPGPHPAEGVFQIHGVAHDQACNDDAMQTHVIHWINTMIAAHATSSQH